MRFVLRFVFFFFFLIFPRIAGELSFDSVIATLKHTQCVLVSVGPCSGGTLFAPARLVERYTVLCWEAKKKTPANADTLSRVPFYPSDTVFAFGDPGPAAEGCR